MEKTKSNLDTQAHRQTVGVWLSRQFEWRIPVYQRHYAWDVDEDPNPVHLFWKTVKEQTEKRLDGQAPVPHYLGTVLVDDRTNRQSTAGIIQYDVVDGQQRLTTIQVALLALVQVAKDKKCGREVMSK